MESAKCVEDLCVDTLLQCLSHLDHYVDLAHCCCVSRMFRQIASRDELWGVAVSNRWNVTLRNGKYKFGESNWKEVYKLFHRRRRLPTVDGFHTREVSYATGLHHRVACW